MIISNATYAGCFRTSSTASQITYSFGSVVVPDSLAIGDVITSLSHTPSPGTAVDCSSGNGQVNLWADHGGTIYGAPVPGMDHTYQTNLAGIGFRVLDTDGGADLNRYYESDNNYIKADPIYWDMSNIAQIVYLVKTSNTISSGQLTEGKIAYMNDDNIQDVIVINMGSTTISTSSGGNKRMSGVDVIKALNSAYADTANSCGSASTPAFLCTGIVLRGTDQFSTSYHSWDPSPDSVSSGGVSFSYLRSDSKYDKLAYSYNNGFIFYPFFNAPDGEGIDTNIDIMCSFPIDGATGNRSDKGCGASNAFPSESGPCQEQGITTADEWYNHYIEGNSNWEYQCGFTTSDNSTYNTADGFYQSILSMAKISSESFETQNELRLATWSQGKQDSLPLEAFFYVNGSSEGLDSARKDQQDFYESTSNHLWVPVIKLTLPSTPTSDASFSFNATDQLIPEPF